ncbi:hypothetical protein Hanom_Chr03g00246661 [Helianthus anomalus]
MENESCDSATTCSWIHWSSKFWNKLFNVIIERLHLWLSCRNTLVGSVFGSIFSK